MRAESFIQHGLQGVPRYEVGVNIPRNWTVIK